MPLLKKLSAFLLAFAATGAFAADVDGEWKTEPQGPDDIFLHVKIAPCAESPELRCGQIVSFHADGAEREDEIVGRWIIENMKEDSATFWDGGTVWAPDDDKNYKAKMELLDQNTLEVSGCVLVFCRGQNWVRVQP